MTCCNGPECPGTNKFFTRFSSKYAKRFRRKGLEKVQLHILKGIGRVPVPSAEVLDIGCGVGALHIALLREGAVRATGVDAAEGMIKQARAFAEKHGVQERVNYVLGDFTSMAADLPSADITILDKVVCCYENVDELVSRSMEKTRRVYAMSMPRERAIVRWGFLTQIFISKLFKAAFTPYWHDWNDLRTSITSRGFRLVYENSTFLWNIVVFERL
ncbi:MAG: class I SAM-dependent methyltransferase [Bacteroidota bacterium]